MAATDITASVSRLPGINNPNYIKSDSYIIDMASNAGLLTAATHSLVSIPAGNAIVGVKVVILTAATSTGSATVKFGLKVGSGSVEDITTATAVAAITLGKVFNYSCSAVTAYSASDATLLQAVVATEALLTLKFQVFIEYIPVAAFSARG